jgi:hypothetical protein
LTAKARNTSNENNIGKEGSRFREEERRGVREREEENR